MIKASDVHISYFLRHGNGGLQCSASLETTARRSVFLGTALIVSSGPSGSSHFLISLIASATAATRQQSQTGSRDSAEP